MLVHLPLRRPLTPTAADPEARGRRRDRRVRLPHPAVCSWGRRVRPALPVVCSWGAGGFVWPCPRFAPGTPADAAAPHPRNPRDKPEGRQVRGQALTLSPQAGRGDTRVPHAYADGTRSGGSGVSARSAGAMVSTVSAGTRRPSVVRRPSAASASASSSRAFSA